MSQASQRKISCDVLHVGFQKCASTFLQQQLFTEENNVLMLGMNNGKHRRQIRKLRIGGLEYHRQEFIDTIARDIPEAANRKVVVSHEALSGDPFNTQGTRFILGELGEVFDPGVVLVGVRNPVDYIYSIWSNHVRLGGYFTLQRFLYHQSSPTRYKNEEGLLLKLDFTSFLEALTSVFGADRTKVFLLEDLHADKAAFIRSLNESCGLSVSVPISRDRPQASLSLTGNRIALFLNLLFSSRGSGTPISILNNHRAWRRNLERIFSKTDVSIEARRRYVLSKLRLEDTERLRTYSRRLADHLGRDLRPLGYDY